MNEKKITKEVIDTFFAGYDPMEHIIKFECGYNDDKVSIIYKNENGEKRVRKEEFRPFVWAKKKAAQALFDGDRATTKKMLLKYNIGCKALRVERNDGTIPERMANGYNLLFYAKGAMTFTDFMNFFQKGGVPIYPNQKDKNYGSKDYICVAPVEQFMIQTGKRQFKGYDDYDDLLRLIYDLETTGLDPEVDMIDQIGISTNKGFERIITVEGEGEEKFDNELKAIAEFFDIIYEIKPDIITGHNRENFDDNFFDVRLKKHGTSLKSFTEGRFKNGIYKKDKQSVLKLGGEMEYYYPTVMWGHHLTDSLFGVRRAMAVNSNIKSANLKYITKYSNLNKENRVYVPGKLINETWRDTSLSYLFNDENGNWLKYEENKAYTDENNTVRPRYSIEGDKIKDNKTGELFVLKTGRYIVERYLLDDLWETDKVEYKYNVTNYFISKMLPVSFDKCCTMGTAAVWKYIMLTWSYENDLAVPQLIDTKKFTGGLSRLLKCGFIKKQAKLDYNSLYPSIILTFGIRTLVDLQDTMPNLLEYLLTQREYYKDLKKKKIKESIELGKQIENAKTKKERIELEHKKKQVDAIANVYDNTQTCIKLICNGFFGSYGSGQPFPHSDILCAEQTTCIGRQALRLMIHHFSNLSKYNGANLGEEYNYVPVVGDSVTYDTPIFIKGWDGCFDILPICDIFYENGEEWNDNEQRRDFTPKNFQVLTRNGWKPIKYIYKHRTDKQLRRIETKNGLVDCTEDHSLFDHDGNEVKPSQLKRGDGIEIYKGKVDYHQLNMVTKDEAWLYGFFMADGSAFYGDRTQKYYSKRKKQIVEHRGKRANWKISNKSLERLEKAQKIITDVFGVKSSIKDHNNSSGVYDLVVESVNMASWFADHFYTSYREKKIPSLILNTGSLEVKKAFLDGFCCGDGQGDTIDECIEFGQKSKVAMAGLYFLLKELNYNFRCHNRKDKPSFLSFRLRNHRGNLLNEKYSKRSEEEVWLNNEITSKDEFVYDISADGTFVNALGMIVCHNTDGFNFELPEKFRYTEEHPYISNGKGRNTKEGKAYTEVDADIAEFEDTFMNQAYDGGINKMGLGLDEYIDNSLNLSRKNYLDLFPDGSLKFVGNTIKSKKMPKYIERFLNENAILLLHGDGVGFLNAYYDYVEKIYNLQIPLKEIATVGKIKTSMETYKRSCNELTAAGNKKSRQAWYELALKHNLNVNMGDSIYYINTGNKKNDSDVKRVTHYYAEIDGERKEVTKQLLKDYKKYNDECKLQGVLMKMSKSEFGLQQYGKTFEEKDEIVFNCVLLSNDIVEDEDEHYCDDNFEYNVAKYVEMFNKRIRPLLVCFSRDIRIGLNEKGKEIDNLLITDPSQRKFFTKEECELVSGQPYNVTDQDTYDDLMTMEDKEIKFWTTVDKKPPYVDEIGMNWEEIKSDYLQRMKEYERAEIKAELEAYNKAIEKLTSADLTKFSEEGILPNSILNIVDEDANSNNFVSKKYPNIIIGNLRDIYDKMLEKYDDEEE